MAEWLRLLCIVAEALAVGCWWSVCQVPECVQLEALRRGRVAAPLLYRGRGVGRRLVLERVPGARGVELGGVEALRRGRVAWNARQRAASAAASGVGGDI